MFESTLAPFIAQKKNLGYKVIVGYTDSPDVGSTTTSIKAYLENLYNNPATGYSPPLYALLVGDIQQVPAFKGSSYGHVTDLYYFDYTGDNLPDVFYGRFSAQNTSQLYPQIEKTLEYENYTMPDASYLFNAVLVSGWSGGIETEKQTNGQVNYIKDQYCNPGNGITAYAYLQEEPAGANYRNKIISNINNGVGFANYTAHCDPNGWFAPSFTTSDIANLTNSHKYGLWIGNCCESAAFNVSECFAEAALRASGKGAVGYIGGSNSTYWNEDYWWSVGFKSIALHPSYDPDHLGAMDRLFHTHGEDEAVWGSRQGQIILGGNLAVQESTSGRKKYYWEIYHLFGDPSLNMRFVPPVTCEENLVIDADISGGNHEYLAEKTITAANNISGNATVHYGANNSVTLAEGFKLEKGSALTIDPYGCTNSGGANSPAQSPASLKGREPVVGNGTEVPEEEFIKVYPDPALEGAYVMEINSKDVPAESVVVSGSSGAHVYRNCDRSKNFIIRPIKETGDLFVKVNFAKDHIVKKIRINAINN